MSQFYFYELSQIDYYPHFISEETKVEPQYNTENKSMRINDLADHLVNNKVL